MANRPKTIKELKQIKDCPAIMANEMGLVVYINEAFQSVLKWEKKNLIGQPLSNIIPEKFHDAHQLGFSRFLSTEIPTILNKPLNLMVLTGENKAIECEHYIIAEKISGVWEFGATIVPVSHL